MYHSLFLAATSDQIKRPQSSSFYAKLLPVPATRKVPAGGGKDALRTERAELNVGLHHSCRLHRGGCNPIPLGRATAQPVKRKRNGRRREEREDSAVRALTRSPHSSPLLPSVTLLLPSSVHSLLGEAAEGSS